jgi:hypothetical protein
MRQLFRDLPRQTQLFVIVLTLTYLATVAWGLPYQRPFVVAGLAAIFAATGLVKPLPNPTGGRLFPTNSVKIVAALLWLPQEVLLGVGLGSFLGLLLFRRTEVWLAAMNGAGWGLASASAAFAAHLTIHGTRLGLGA